MHIFPLLGPLLFKDQLEPWHNTVASNNQKSSVFQDKNTFKTVDYMRDINVPALSAKARNGWLMKVSVHKNVHTQYHLNTQYILTTPYTLLFKLNMHLRLACIYIYII